MKKLILLVLFFSSFARADLVTSIGVGKGIMEGHGTPFERVGILGYQFNAGDFFVRPQAGYFLDVSGQNKSSIIASTLFGVRAVSQVGPELHLAVGPAYLQHPDGILGGHFQFNLEGGVGLLSKDGKTYVGAAWEHFSSAGFEMPNLGRDFIVLQVRLFIP